MILNERITSKTALYGVIGNPIRHSLSPQIHNTLAQFYGLDMVYTAFLAEANQIDSLLKGLFQSGIRGLNVTMPFKETAYQFADVCCQEVSVLKAANTLVRKNDGVHAYNTDCGGFLKAFQIQTGKTFKGLNIAILGSGATCRTLTYAVAGQGAKRVTIISRTADKSKSVADFYRNHFKNDPVENDQAGVCRIEEKKTESCYVKDDRSENCQAENCEFDGISYSDEAFKTVTEECDVIINTTPLGLYRDHKEFPGAVIFRFKPAQYVVDLVYNPKETFFLKSAYQDGAVVINGLGMLICQAVSSFELFTDISVGEKNIMKLLRLLNEYI